MSSVEETGDNLTISCCANCGAAEVDDIKLKKCGACNSVRYCGVKCQKEHRPKHKKACKQRAAELRDELLFKQPESTHEGDCPICFLPLPLGNQLKPCCGKVICFGCDLFNNKSECPFCRTPRIESREEGLDLVKKRADANDPAAVRYLGRKRYDKGDYAGAFEYYSKAARLGDVEAHHDLSVLYRDGKGVERDKKKELHHLEEATIGGHPEARHTLARFELESGRYDRMVKQLIIAAKQGLEDSIQMLKKMYAEGMFVCKEDLTSALRGYQAAVDATKSKQRELAEEAILKLERI